MIVNVVVCLWSSGCLLACRKRTEVGEKCSKICATKAIRHEKNKPHTTNKAKQKNKSMPSITSANPVSLRFFLCGLG